MEFSRYDQILTKQVIFIFVICFVVCIISVLGIMYAIRKLDKKDVIICTVGLTAVILGVIVFSSIYISTRIYDIKNDAYITHCGDFKVVSNGRSDILVYIENNSIKLDSGAELDEGEFIGTVVYSKRSKVVLNIEGTKK